MMSYTDWTNGRAHYNRGVALAELGRHVEASKAFIRALQLNADAPHVWRHLRMSLFRLQQQQQQPQPGGSGPDAPSASEASAAGQEQPPPRWAETLIALAYDMDVDGLARELDVPPPPDDLL